VLLATNRQWPPATLGLLLVRAEESVSSRVGDGGAHGLLLFQESDGRALMMSTGLCATSSADVAVPLAVAFAEVVVVVVVVVVLVLAGLLTRVPAGSQSGSRSSMSCTGR
jgi:hypothetical protein